MDTQKILKGKWILVVDDEEDILQLVYELLEMCKIDTASSYEQGKALLEKNQYHAGDSRTSWASGAMICWT